MEHNGARVYIYTRVSTSGQVEGYSLDAQKSKMKEYANYQKMQIVGEYSDEGISGKNIEKRAQFKQMLQDIESKKDDVSFVLVFKLSRFGRNAADTLQSLQFMQDYGVNLISIEENLDSSAEMGKLMISIMAAMAEMERENILVQSMAGRRQKATEGGWNGGFAPYGYTLENGKIVINEEEAEVVRKIFCLYVEEQLGAVGVSKRLNVEGIKKEKRQKHDIDTFSAHFIKLVLDNPIYMGKIAYGRRKSEKIEGKRNQYRVVKEKDGNNIILSDGNHEAIVSEEMWYRAQARRKETGVRKEKVEQEHEYIFSGLVVCPGCGKRMYGIPSRKKKKDGTYYPTYYSYACRQNGNQTGHRCPSPMQIRCSKIDEEIESVIIHHMWSKESEEALAKQLSKDRDTDSLKEEVKKYKETLKKYEAQIKKYESQQDALDVLDSNYDLLFDSFTRRLSEVFTKQNELKKLIKEVESKISAIESQTVSEEKALQMLLNFGQHYETLSDYKKKKLMNVIIDSVDIFPKKSETGYVKTIHLKVPLDFYGQMTDTIEMSEYLEHPDWIDLNEEIRTVEDLERIEEKYSIKVSERQRKEIVKQIGGKSSKVAMTIGEPKEMIQGIGTKDMKINIPFEFKSLDDIEKYEKMLNRKMTEDSKKAIVAELVKKGLAPLNSMSKLFPPKETPVETVCLLSKVK